MFCDQCGTENRNDRKFCSNCGAKLRDYTKPRENLIMPDEVEKEQELVRKRNQVQRITFILLSVFFAIAIAGTVLTFFMENVLFWVVVGVSLFGFLAMLITYIVRLVLLNKIKKAQKK